MKKNLKLLHFLHSLNFLSFAPQTLATKSRNFKWYIYRLKRTLQDFHHSLHTWIKRKSFKQKQEPNPEASLVLSIFIPALCARKVATAHVWMNWPSHHRLLVSRITPASSCIIKKIYHYSMFPKPSSFCSLYLKEAERSRIEKTTGEEFLFCTFVWLKALFFKLNLRPQ